MDKKPTVVILGAGFGGLWAADALANRPVEVLLLDKNNYHTFLPLLYQVAAAELEPERIAQPVRSMLHDHPNVHFRLMEVQGVDTATQEVFSGEQRLAYDYLIVALGSTNHFFGIPGVAEHCFTLKSIEEGITLRNHILYCLEQAVQTADPAGRAQLLTFVIIGGGPTGVEYAGALAELLYQPLAKDFPELNLRQTAKVILIEAGTTLLPGIGGGEYAAQRLQQIGVEVRLNTTVSCVTPTAVQFKDGSQVETASAVWTAGVQGVKLAQDLPLARGRGGRIPITPTLQLENLPNVFVIGDLAYLEQEGQMLPGVAQVAMQQGVHAAENILRHTQNQPLQPFWYKDKGSMATIGRNAAVANIGRRQYTGFVAWVIWLFIHLFFLIGFRNRLGVLINWAWNYIFYERVVRLIIPSKK